MAGKPPVTYEAMEERIRNRMYVSYPRLVSAVQHTKYLTARQMKALEALGQSIYSETPPTPRATRRNKQVSPFVVSFTRFVNRCDDDTMLLLNQALAEGYTLPALLQAIEEARAG